MKAFVTSGDYEGVVVFPHQNRNGHYVASPTRFEADYIYVSTLDELETLARSGLNVRMSNPEKGVKAPSLRSPSSIEFETPMPKLSIAKILEKLAGIKDLDAKTQTTYRKEQHLLKLHLLSKEKLGFCALCNNEYPAQFLVAAHIKRRSKCTKHERLDFDNVATLMCKGGCDDLYEKGYVFVEGGVVTKNPFRETTSALDLLISNIVGKVVKNWAGSANYYGWHKKSVNKKP